METLCEKCRDGFPYIDINTLLYRAANRRNLSCVNVLIKAGANVNGNKNCNGNTVLIYIGVRIDRPEDPRLVQCISLLLTAGTDVNLVNCNKYSALMYFSREGCVNCVRLLIKGGASVNLKNKNGESALSLGALTDKARCMKVLIEAGADVNNINTRGGETVLHWACGNVDCLKILLQSGVRINRSNIQLQNALTSYMTWPYDVTKENVMILFAAGETIDGTVVMRGSTKPVNVSNFLPCTEFEPCLKSMCRSAIRHYLMNIDPHENLFRRIPLLGLSQSLSQYLLYDVTLHDMM